MYLIFALIFLFNLQIQENIILKLEIIPIIFLSLVSTPSIMYSIEKQGVLLYKLYPVNLTKILVLKYIFNIIIILPEFFILLYFSNIGSIYLYIYLMIHLIVTTFIKLLYDYKVPILKYNNVQQLMENKRKYKIWGTILILSLNILVYYYCNSIIFIGSYILLTILIIMKITKFKDRKDNIDRVLQNKIF